MSKVEKDPKHVFEKELKSFVTNTLRRASFRWKPRNDALVDARVERGLYRCAQCGMTFKRGDVQLDHIVPVISLKEGHTTWDKFIEHLFCPKEGYQVICTVCHDTKTMQEDMIRAMFNQERKAEEKEQEKVLKQYEKDQRKKKKKEE